MNRALSAATRERGASTDNKKPPGTDPAVLNPVGALDLSELDVGGLLAAAAAIVLDLKRYFVAFVEGGHAAPLESGSMYEHVLAAVLGLNEAKAARMIEEFHCAVDTSHRGNSFPVEVNTNGP